MKPERWQQLDQLFHSALERAPGERAAFLDRSCAGDHSLRKQVEALLSAHGQAGSFIESPALEVEARCVADDQVGSAVGQTIGHYEVISLLGAGGMGEVYLAQDTHLDRKIALKILPAQFTGDPDRVRRFQQEARAASALNHPNIITIHEIGQLEDRHFIATELIDGETLRRRITGVASGSGNGKSGTSHVVETLNIAIQAADGLAAAHEAGIIHRDIKPENIMVRRRDGYVKVLDFGLAKLTESPPIVSDPEAPTRIPIKTSAGLVMGTVTYMSPEQARGEKVDLRTDIWSLGVVLYEMLAGTAPFARSTPSEIIALILEREPPPLTHYARQVPPELERIVIKTLTKDREERYQTAKDLLVDLRRLRQRLEVEAEIERTAQPEKSDEEKAVASSSEPAAVATADLAKVAAEDISVAHSAAHPAKTIKLNKRAALIIVAVLGVASAGAYFAYSRYVGGNRGMIRSVAVLPFANQANDPTSDYLSDGISESLINSLSQLPGVKVIARSSSFKYKGKEPQEAANALGVEAILTGRVLQRGDNLLISVELIDARDRTQVWGEQYNRRATDVLQVQAEISREIAENLRLQLTAREQQQITKLKNVNPQAYELLIKGRFTQRKGGPDNRKKAIEYYQQAISVDPTYARAYAELSTNYNILFAQGILDPKEFLPKAEAAARRALEFDENLADAHSALAFVLGNKWDWTMAERENKRAIELNPNLAEAHVLYSIYLMQMGRHDEAITEAKRAREIDPLWPRTSAQLGSALAGARRYEEAIESLKKTLEMDPSFALVHGSLGYTYAAMGRYTEAIAEYEEMFRLNGEPKSLSGQIYLGAACAKAGERGKAQEILKLMETTRGYVSPTELAILYAALGQREQALASLEKAYAAHDLQLASLGVDVSFDSLREEPRFKDLMRRVGLTP